MPTASSAPGDPVRIEMTKWGGRRHWEFDGFHLGSDQHGEWLGYPVGTPHARPGGAYVSEVETVTLVPHDGAFLATFHAPGVWCTVYVDIATPATWDHAGERPVLRSVDLDLDVVRESTGRVYVDDEDEFAEHRVSLGYPPEIVTLAETTCARVHDDVVAARPPYDGVADGWLGRLRALD